jgi:hypothetical protein
MSTSNHCNKKMSFCSMDAELLLNFLRWHSATEGISLGAKGLLILLIVKAADAGRLSIPVNESDMRLEMPRTEDRATLSARFAELRLRGLIRETTPGLFVIAQSLWRFGQNRSDDPYISLV